MEHINDILAKHFSGNSSPEDEKLIAVWKADNESEYAILSEAWSEKIIFKEYDNKSAWDKIEGKIDFTESKTQKTKVFRLGKVMRFAGAACFAIIIGLGAKWFFSADKFLAFENHTAHVQQFDLPDGSIIYLAPDSELQYDREFKENRDVILDGEAFFEVARDEKHPFIIQAKIGEIEVLGTSFNVNSEDGLTTVVVERGLVVVRNNNIQIELKEGESAEAKEDGVNKIENFDFNYQSWRTGEFVFDNISLENVVAELNEFFEQEIIIESEEVKSERITGHFDNQSLEEIIEIITLTCDVQSESTEDKIILK